LDSNRTHYPAPVALVQADKTACLLKTIYHLAQQ
jgi:hypothetical protein